VREPTNHLPCSFDGCESPRRTKGLCAGHYSQLRRGIELQPIGRKVCTFEGCERFRHGNGLCQGHYTQQIRGQDLHPIHEPTRHLPCTFDGCEQLRRTHELCGGHYQQALAGRPLAPLVCPIEECEGVPAKDSDGLCKVHKGCSRPGCDQPHHGRGMCEMHAEWDRRAAPDDMTLTERIESWGFIATIPLEDFIPWHMPATERGAQMWRERAARDRRAARLAAKADQS
jgi:hypothetical protein